MAKWNDLKTAIAQMVKTNGNQEITGQLLQNVLNNIVSSVGENSTFAGIAIPTTNPGVPDGNVFYLATETGTYANFNGISVANGEAVILEWRGSWIKKTSGFATAAKLTELEYISSINDANKFIKECYIHNPNNLELYLTIYRRTSPNNGLFAIKVKGTNETFLQYNKEIDFNSKYIEVKNGDNYGYFIINWDIINNNSEKTFNADILPKSYSQEGAPYINALRIKEEIEKQLDGIKADGYIVDNLLNGFFNVLYLEGITDVSNIVLRRIYNNQDISGYKYGFYFYSKEDSNPLCRYLSTQKPKKDEIIKIEQYRDSGISGYAVVDFDKIPQGEDNITYYLTDKILSPKIYKEYNLDYGFNRLVSNSLEIEKYITDTNGSFTNVEVQNQEEFDSLMEKLDSYNTDINGILSVKIASGIYRFKESHINFTNVSENKKISIVGNNDTYIISDGDTIEESQKVEATLTHNVFNFSNYTGYEVFLDDELNAIDKSSTNPNFFVFAKSEIYKDNEEQKIAKFQLPDDYPQNLIPDKGFVLFTSWFVSNYCEITKIENGFVYFKAEENWDRFDSYINGNYSQYKVPPMFELHNIGLQVNRIYYNNNKLYVPKAIKRIYVCRNKTFFKIENSPNISCYINLNFVGSALDKNKGLIELSNAKNIYITSNFENIGGLCVYSRSDFENSNLKSNNINVINCHASNLYNKFVYAIGKNIKVNNNNISDNNKIYLTSAIKVTGTNYEIRHNKIQNSPYHSISIGVSREEAWEVSGTVEYNLCFSTIDFISTNRILSDFGLISFFTKNDNSICRYNVCYNAYSPVGEARGIFGDDGCRGLTLIGNLTFMNKTYGIDVRFVKNMPLSNSGNVAYYNIVTDKFRFEGGAIQDGYVVPIFKENLYNYLTAKNIDIQQGNTLIEGNAYNDIVYIQTKMSNLNFIKSIPSFVLKHIVEKQN